MEISTDNKHDLFHISQNPYVRKRQRPKREHVCHATHVVDRPRSKPRATFAGEADQEQLALVRRPHPIAPADLCIAADDTSPLARCQWQMDTGQRHRRLLLGAIR